MKDGHSHSRNNSAIDPYLGSNLLETFCVRVIDEGRVASRRKEYTVLLLINPQSLHTHHTTQIPAHLRPIQLLRLHHVIQLLSELSIDVLPLLAIALGQEIRLQAQPVGNICSVFGGEVDLEASVLEDVEWMQGFADEEACLVAVVQNSVGGGYGDYGSSWGCHFESIVGCKGLPR